MERLPIDQSLPAIVAGFDTGPNLVIEAPPGAGKTTRVPARLLDAGLAGAGEVLVLEPRRLAARLGARRVAEERGERLGETVGYRMRFESVGSARTRLRYVTEGVLGRMLASAPTLPGVGLVVFDEIHERHWQADLALALCRRLQRGARPDLRLCAMSATLDAAPLARLLADAPVMRAEGRRFEVSLEHLPRPDGRPLAAQVAGALRQLLADGLQGHVLVFLPGAAEIRDARRACEPVAAAAELELCALHGQLTASEQDRALAPSVRRKVILATNVAESSVTIEGVEAVIDSGLCRSAGHAPWSGLPTLRVVPVSRASAAQRAGRAGRTRPGRCLRLYTRADHDRRPAHDEPEICRSDLTEAVLVLRACGVDRQESLDWLDAPPPTALAAADRLLGALGAVDGSGALSRLGRGMLDLPVHPRLARVLLEAMARGVTAEACVCAALLGERELELGRRAVLAPTASGRPTARRESDATRASDLEPRLELFEQARALDFEPRALTAAGIDRSAALAVERAREAIERACAAARPSRHARSNRAEPSTAGELDSRTRLCLLSGFPDRVAHRVRDRELGLAGGGGATLGPGSVVREAPFVVVLDAEERLESSGRRVVARVVSAIEPEWLIELFPEAVREHAALEWSPERERVERIERLLYQGLALDEQRRESPPGPEAARLLGAAALGAGFDAFAPEGAVTTWLGRLRFVREAVPESGLPALDEAAARELLTELCTGRRSFAELREAHLLEALEARLDAKQRQVLQTAAPARVRLPSGRMLPVHYERAEPPWVASRLQDFFGMAEGPTLARGRVPLVLRLLAPNGRPVQITSDLGSFWKLAYPELRRALARRYPKHAWPEDGRRARPPTAGKAPRR